MRRASSAAWSAAIQQHEGKLVSIFNLMRDGAGSRRGRAEHLQGDRRHQAGNDASREPVPASVN